MQGHQGQTATAEHATDLSAVIAPAFHHLTLKTTRLDEMIDWYAVVLGLTDTFRYDGGAWLTNDTSHHRIALLTTPAVAEDEQKLVHAGLHHYAFEYAELDELLATYERLKASDLLPHAVLDHGMTLSFYYLDPDGNSLELQVDNFGNWRQSGDWMRTSPDFAADPIGPPCDPEALLAARRSGLSHAEIHERAYRGEYPAVTAPDLRLPF